MKKEKRKNAIKFITIIILVAVVVSIIAQGISSFL